MPAANTWSNRSAPSALRTWASSSAHPAVRLATPQPGPPAQAPGRAGHDALCTDLDQLVREGARRMLAAALGPRSTPTWPPTPASVTGRAAGWWDATATPASGRC